MIDVIYLSRGVDYGIKAVEKFADTYKHHPAGCEHKLTIAAKAWDKKSDDYKRLLNIAHELNASIIYLPDDGFDFMAYYRVAKKLRSKFIFCIPTTSEIMYDNWLKKFEDNINANPNLRLAGSTGSWEICPIAYEELKKELKNPYNIFAKIIKCLPYLYLIYKQKTKPLKYPNYHIRSGGFIIERKLYIDFIKHHRKPRHKVEAYNLESGHDSMTKFVLKKGYDIGVVGADGILYNKEEWNISRTFRYTDISNLLIKDKQCYLFDSFDDFFKKKFINRVWNTTLKNNLKIFVTYHKPDIIFKSPIFVPIQTNCNNSKYNLNIMKDNTGDNIADKNEFYGELTAHYWVWKNYFKKNPELEYIGFCQYRKFLDFFNEPKTHIHFNKTDTLRFKQYFDNNYTYENIFPIINKYDLIISNKLTFNEFYTNTFSVKEQYEKSGHPLKELHDFVDIIKNKYPDYENDIEDFLNGNTMYVGTVLVTKKDLYEQYLNWIFPLLFELEKKNNWNAYRGTYNVRIPAFLFERFFNVWLNHKNKSTPLKILERNAWLLTNTNTKKIAKIKPVKLETRKEKFTFAMPVYNGFPYIKDAVESIIGQDYKNWELYILESCSNDGTEEYLKTLNDPRIKIIYSDKPLSIEENWARIMDIPMNDYLCIAAQDDTYNFDYLTSILELIQEYPNCNIYRTNINLMNANSDIFYTSDIKEKITIYDFLEGRLRHTYTETFAGYCIKSSKYKELGGIDCKFRLMSTDDKLIMEAIGNNKYMAISPYHSVNYRCHKGSESGSPKPEATLDGYNYWLNWIYNLNDKELRDIVSKYLPIHIKYIETFWDKNSIKKYKEIYKLYNINEKNILCQFIMFKIFLREKCPIIKNIIKYYSLVFYIKF